MHKQQSDVREFHIGIGQEGPTKPTLRDDDIARLRFKLISEELSEFARAAGLRVSEQYVISYNENDRDIVEIADAIADLLYVVYGTADMYGINIQPIWDEVQKSNMAKLEGGYRREDGKWMKPEGWQPPKLEPLIQELCNNYEYYSTYPNGGGYQTGNIGCSSVLVDTIHNARDMYEEFG